MASARFPDLEGKAAVVTGTSRGIGCGIAEFLARQGMRLVLCARSTEAGEAFAAALREGGAEVWFTAADLATTEGARRVFDAAVERLGRIDLVVNNAARTGGGTFLDLDESRYREWFEGNVRMVYGLGRLVASHMVAAGTGGSIVHVSSVGGLRAHRGQVPYDAAKGAIDSLTRAMALELAPHGVRVNAVAPGLTVNRPPKDGRPSAFVEKARTGVPLGRAGMPEDIGAAVAFLASDAGSYITGQVLYVDGGLTAQLTPPGIFI